MRRPSSFTAPRHLAGETHIPLLWTQPCPAPLYELPSTSALRPPPAAWNDEQARAARVDDLVGDAIRPVIKLVPVRHLPQRTGLLLHFELRDSTEQAVADLLSLT